MRTRFTQRGVSTKSSILILSRDKSFSIWPSQSSDMEKLFVNSGGALSSDVLQVLVGGTSSSGAKVLVRLHVLVGVQVLVGLKDSQPTTRGATSCVAAVSNAFRWRSTLTTDADRGAMMAVRGRVTACTNSSADLESGQYCHFT
jgi:hypothetical protein